MVAGYLDSLGGMPARALIVCLIVGTALCIRTAHAGDKPDTPAEYVQALSVANAFLNAWVMRDTETGLRLLSEAVRNPPAHESEVDRDSSLRQYLSGLSAPHHQAFELGHGRRTSPGKFVFPVTLYEYATGMSGAFSYRSEIELVSERGRWVIGRLPRSGDNP